jgi:hypothetical protein
MKFSWLLLLCCVLYGMAEAQITLNGDLQTDTGKLIPNTQISVAGGPSDVTDSKGQFSIKLSLDFLGDWHSS